MATRYRVYQYDWGFMTIDTKTEPTPEGWTAEYQVNIDEAELMQDGAVIEIIDGEAVVRLPDSTEGVVS